MDIVAREKLKYEPLSIVDCKESLIRLLYEEACENDVFTEADALLGGNAFEKCYDTPEKAAIRYRFFMGDFYKATGKKFHGEFVGDAIKATPEDYAPNKDLSKEEYERALMDVVFAAKAGTIEAGNWMPFFTGREYEMRMTYAEFLALNAGCNAWDGWLSSMLDFGCTKEACEDFAKKAIDYFVDRFFEDVEKERRHIKARKEAPKEFGALLN